MSIDLSIFLKGTNNVLTQTMATPTNNGETVTGVYKLMQRVLIELMTEKGSLIHQPTRGSSFVPLLRKGSNSTWDLLAAFSTAMLDVSANLKAEDDEQSASGDNTDKIGAVDLLSVTIVKPGVVALSIRIRNLANQALNTTIPITFNNL